MMNHDISRLKYSGAYGESIPDSNRGNNWNGRWRPNRAADRAYVSIRPRFDYFLFRKRFLQSQCEVGSFVQPLPLDTEMHWRASYHQQVRNLNYEMGGYTYRPLEHHHLVNVFLTNVL
jgi:hypothetical protein